MFSGILLGAVAAEETVPEVADGQPQATLRFSADVAPIMVQHCIECHGGSQAEGGYSLDTFAGPKTPGDSGLAPITSQDPQQSELFRRLTTHDESELMPEGGPRLDESKIVSIRTWIEQGGLCDHAESEPIIDFAVELMNHVAIPEHYPRPLPISSLALSGDGSKVYTSGYGEILIWNAVEGSLSKRLPVHGTRISDLDLSTNQEWLVCASGNPGLRGTVEAFQLNKENDQWAPKWTIKTKDLPIDIAISPNNESILIGLSTGAVQVVRCESGEEAYTVNSHAAAITSLAWSADSEKFYSSSRDRMAKVYRGSDGVVTASFTEHERVVGGIVPASQGAVTYEETGRLRNWWTDSVNTHANARNDSVEPRVAKMVGDSKYFLVPAIGAVRQFSEFSEEVDDGTDDEGKPKKKWRNSFKEAEKIKLPAGQLPLSLAMVGSNEEALIAAGLNDGTVMVWRKSDPNTPVSHFLAMP